MSDSSVAYGDEADIDSEEPGERRRDRRWWGLIAIVLLLLLLLCCVTSSAQVWVTGGKQQARFIARNAECLQCHTELIPDFSKASVHNPFANKECSACHTPHGKKITVSVTSGAKQIWKRVMTGIQWLPLRWWFRLTDRSVQQVRMTAVSAASAGSVEIKGADSQLILPEVDLCWMCHGDLGAKRGEAFQHQPFEASRCTNCHDPHGSDYGPLLTMAPNEICLTCHPIGEELARTQSHPPAKEGWCTNCHDPHASEFRGILVARQRELCFRCHPSVGIKDGLAVQHAPFLNDECSSCHEPHGSDYLPLLMSELPKLCYECHPAISEDFARASHHPIGLELTCAGCHDPHAAPYQDLLTARDNLFCYNCHAEFEAGFEPSAHNQSLCIGCHTPHGSDYQPILRQANPDLCIGCHGARGYDDRTQSQPNHPVRPVFYDINARKDLNCTTSCHNPHGSDKGRLLRYFGEGTDGNCLMCHAVTEGERVGIDF